MSILGGSVKNMDAVEKKLSGQCCWHGVPLRAGGIFAVMCVLCDQLGLPCCSSFRACPFDLLLVLSAEILRASGDSNERRHKLFEDMMAFSEKQDHDVMDRQRQLFLQ